MNNAAEKVNIVSSAYTVNGAAPRLFIEGTMPVASSSRCITSVMKGRRRKAVSVQANEYTPSVLKKMSSIRPVINDSVMTQLGESADGSLRIK